MTTVPDDVDVVVVGGGLAGLAAARRLHRSGRSWVLVEAADRLGGRVATDVVDGYRLDRGFQVLNTAYPRLAALVDLDALRLRYLTPAVLVRRGPHLHRFAHPRWDPVRGAASVRADVGTLPDRIKLGSLLARYGVLTPAGLLAEPEVTTEALLRRTGLSGRIVEELVRPFLSGVFADRELATSSHVFAMVARSFVRGRIGVPEGGMGDLPVALARPLPADRLVLNTPVVAVEPGRVRTGGGEIRCRAVIVATDPPAAARLLPALGRPSMRGLTTYYHGTAAPPLPEPVLLLDGDRREVVANTIVLSLAAPRYAPAGRHLVATTVVGDPAPEPLVRSELERLYGAPAADWETVSVVHVPDALPAAPPPQGNLRKPVALGNGLFVAGDHRDTPSIQGALASGWRTATAALR